MLCAVQTLVKRESEKEEQKSKGEDKNTGEHDAFEGKLVLKNK